MTLPISPAAIDADALLDELLAWVAIETPSRVPEAVNRLVARVAARAGAAGFEVTRIPCGEGSGDALRVRVPGRHGNGHILMLAHLDTVHALGALTGPHPLRRDGDRYYGPGIYDMKSGGVIALEALRLAVGAGLGRPVELLFTPDEEIGSLASRGLIERCAEGPSCALVMEPARDGGKIVLARKGVATCDIVVRGRASHAGTRPQDGRSAIRAAARLVLELEAMADPARGISVTVGTIQGGTGRNTVPAECHLEVDIRLPDLTLADEVLGRIKALRPVDPDVTLDLVTNLNRPPFARTPGGDALFARAASAAALQGIALEGMTTGGGSDGNFTAALGVPTLDGLGVDGAGAHTFGEHILVSSIAPRTALLANLLLALDTPLGG
jgi:glutamate carboxypeptidase